AMGQPMARCIAKSGHRVVAFNRTRERATALEADGVTIARSPADAAGSGIVVTMVADDGALEPVTHGVDGVLAGLPPDGLHVSMSTIGAGTAEALARAHAAAGRRFIAAPVFGRPAAAAEAKLFVVAAGAPADIVRARPILEAVGQRTFEVGERPE